jgi:hypothetical protein
MDAIRRMGYDVVEDAKFMSRGEFDIAAEPVFDHRGRQPDALRMIWFTAGTRSSL